ncbi:MAG: 4Fe-4S dicluster domain-containing protein [candidate division Zixibacteria bacterium]|nr:4Fe-4S dicluster domain-containing protein [candidate division Zixibacteria bacterium]
MPLKISYRTINKEFQDKVKEISGQSFYKCFQCGTCAGSCPMSEQMNTTPRKLMALLQLGREVMLDEVNTPWVCASCYTCEVRCPRGIDIPRIMEALRLITLRQNRNQIEPSNLQPEEIIDLPQIAMVSGFRKFTG